MLFNWFGYRWLISFIEVNADANLEQHLDENNYDESGLITITVPLVNISYYNNSTQFERVDGQVEINGVQYKYVKRRLYNDSVELICIPNQKAMNLCSIKNEFFKLVNDIQHKENKKNSPSFSKNVLNDYLIFHHSFEWNHMLSYSFDWRSLPDESMSSHFSPVVENPPEKFSLLSCI